MTTSRVSLATAEEVAEYLRRPVATLKQWRYLSTGPKWVKVGHQVRYRWTDVEDWLRGRTGGQAA